MQISGLFLIPYGWLLLKLCKEFLQTGQQNTNANNIRRIPILVYFVEY